MLPAGGFHEQTKVVKIYSYVLRAAADVVTDSNPSGNFSAILLYTVYVV